MRPDNGYSLVELLVGMLLTALLVTSALLVANYAAETSWTQPEVADAQERARLALQRIARDIGDAGAGPTAGPAVGPLGQYFAPIIPRRVGPLGDPWDSVRPDALTMIWMRETPRQAVLARPSVGTTIGLQAEPGCAMGDPACGFRAGTSLALFDDTARFDLATVTTVAGGDLTVLPRTSPDTAGYAAGMPVVEVEARSYYFDAASGQLRQYDTDRTDRPIIDGVVSFSVEYLGTAYPSSFPKPPIGVANCLYDASGVHDPTLQILPAAPSGLAPLPLAMLSDGPWCGAAGSRFDADVLRIRQVRVSLRVEAPTAWRSRSPGHANPGHAGSLSRSVPDYSLAVVVSPRNMSIE